MDLVEYAIAQPKDGRVVLNTEVPTSRVRVVVWCFGVESETAYTQTDVSAEDAPFPEARRGGEVHRDASGGVHLRGRRARLRGRRRREQPAGRTWSGTPLQGGPISLDIRLLGDSGLEDARLCSRHVRRAAAGGDRGRTRALRAVVRRPADPIPARLWGDPDGFEERRRPGPEHDRAHPRLRRPTRVRGAALRTLELLVDGEVIRGTDVSGRVVGGNPGGGSGGSGELDLSCRPGRRTTWSSASAAPDRLTSRSRSSSTPTWEGVCDEALDSSTPAGPCC